ncbi:hypothetical protein [Streptomyces sp. CC208A]|uniref:hypothetical protein n=1 Tax=Streptomyces sp. CC208A TaxID=3044573 RepID=UPI0024A90C6C|nr:hypothetical protein [Streptomyces sp. CC208A]
MGDLSQQIQDVARLLDVVGTLPPLSVTFARHEDSPYVLLATPHQLPLADQRLAVDRIAARIRAVPTVHEVLAGRFGVSVKGPWESTVIVAVTNAAPQLPGVPDLPDRATTTSGTAEVLRSLAEWAEWAEPDVDELTVKDLSRTHSVYATVLDDAAAQRLLEDLVPDAGYVLHRPGRRYRSLLPTGHLFHVSVDSQRQ